MTTAIQHQPLPPQQRRTGSCTVREIGQTLGHCRPTSSSGCHSNGGVVSLWMITNRNVASSGFGTDRASKLTYWTAVDDAPADVFTSWTRQTLPKFKDMLLGAIQEFPSPTPDGSHEDQKHVTLLIHGYNTPWD